MSEPLTIAVPARRAVRRHARPARRARRRHRRGALERPQAAVPEDAGIVTMRPSDVPTYVEHGAVDLGITGKDVLMEQRERDVYELLDLGYGHCRMVVATREGDDPLGELAAPARRASGSRPSTRASPRATSRAPAARPRSSRSRARSSWRRSTGLADGIVDLTATGRTLRENELEVREEIADCTARLVANRVAHKLRRREIDELVERIRCALRIATRRTRRGRACARSRRPPRDVEATSRRSSTRCATAATTAVLRAAPSASTRPSCARTSCGWPRASSRRRSACSSPRCSTACARRSRTCGRVAEAELREPVAVELPEGQRVELAELPVRRAGVYVPGGRARLPVDGGDVRGARARRRRRARSRSARRRGPTGAPTR